MIKSSLVSQ